MHRSKMQRKAISLLYSNTTRILSLLVFEFHTLIGDHGNVHTATDGDISICRGLMHPQLPCDYNVLETLTSFHHTV